MKYFYAAGNHYGSESSIGFCNTWFIRVFGSKKSRDAWVSDTDRLDRRAITKKDVTRYIGAPKPFSGQYLAITQDPIDDACLYVGIVDNEYDALSAIRRLYSS